MDIFEGCPVEDLVPLAACVQPLRAAAGQVLMQQGEQAVSFPAHLVGHRRDRHASEPTTWCPSDRRLRARSSGRSPCCATSRIATVTTTEPLTGWVGDNDAFTRMVQIPGVMPRLLPPYASGSPLSSRPIPIRVRDGTDLLPAPGAPGDGERTVHGHVLFSSETLYRRFMTARAAHPRIAALPVAGRLRRPLRVGGDRRERPGGRRALCSRPGRSDGRRDRVHRRRRLSGPGHRELLIGALSIAAKLDGVERFSARMLSENAPMRAIMDHLRRGLGARRRRGDYDGH